MFQLLPVNYPPMIISTKEDVEKLIDPQIHDATLFINGDLINCRKPQSKTSIALLNLFAVYKHLNLDIIIYRTPNIIIDKRAEDYVDSPMEAVIAIKKVR